MADVVISEISAAIVRKGHPISKYSILAATGYIPGDWLYYTAANTVTIIATGTPICKLVKPLLLGFEPRISATKQRKDIDDTYNPQVTGPVICGGWTGPLLIAATTEDPGGGGLLKGIGMMASNTAGDIEVQDAGKDPTGGLSGPACIITYEDQVNTDVVGMFLYK